MINKKFHFLENFQENSCFYFFDKSGITVRMDMKNVIVNFDSLQIE